MTRILNFVILSAAKNPCVMVLFPESGKSQRWGSIGR